MDESTIEQDQDPSLKHYTREPWWLIPLAGFIVGLLPLIRYGKFQRSVQGISLIEGMLLAACLGMLGASVLVVRSHVRNSTLANVILWVGILVVTLGICAVSVMFF